MNRSIVVILMFVAALCFGQLRGNEIKIDSYLDSMNIIMGDQVDLHVKVKTIPGYNLGLPKFQDTIMDKVEIVKQTGWDTVSWPDSLIISNTLTLTSFDSGFYVIPPIKINIDQPNVKDSLYSSVNLLAVFGIKIDSTNAIVDIKAAYEAPLTMDEVLLRLKNFVKKYWYLLLLLFIIIGGVVYYFISKKTSEEVVPEIPKEPAHIIAFRELEALKHQELWQSNQLKLYYSRLTEILRRYLEGRFEFPAMEQTSDEIVSEVTSIGAISDVQIQKELKELLALADFVKFAKGLADASENEGNFQRVYTFVELTKASSQSNDHLTS